MPKGALSIFLSVVFLLRPAIALAGDMDLLLRSIAGKKPSASWSKSLLGDEASALVPCILKTSDAAATARAVENFGGRMGRVAGSIVTAKIPAGNVRAVASRAEVTFAEFGIPLSRKMDTARAAGEVDVVQDGSSLGVSYDGKNVVVGIVDDSLDYGHPDFSDASDATRIQYVRQRIDGEVLECTKRNVTDRGCAIEDEGQGGLHGTHVTGIAAGSDSTYTGVAPAADIMFFFVGVEDPYTSGTAEGSFSTAVLEGVSTIFEKADLIDKAAVVNLSLGTSLGAHDGTWLLEEGLGELTEGKAGRIVVCAAGNEQVVPAAHSSARRDYLGGIHAAIDVDDGASKGWRIGVWSGSGVASTFVEGTMVDLWLLPGQSSSCSMEVYGYTEGRADNDFTFPGLASTDDADLKSGSISFSSDSSLVATSDDGNINVSLDTDDADARNEKPHGMVLLAAAEGAAFSALETQWFDIVVRASGGDCDGHMWLYYDYTPYHDFLDNVAGGAHDVAAGANGAGYSLQDGDSFYTMTIPATAEGVISVGSWLAEKPIASGMSEWTGMNGNTYDQSNIDSPGGSGSTVDDLSAFSSLGPAADGRTKPDVVAPGEPIISSKARATGVSSSIAVDDYHYKNAGTSMASPYVTGVVALLLERNNTLGVEGVRAALRTGARTAGLVSKTSDPENSFGAGKIDAAAALASVSVDKSAYNGTGDLESPAGGCALVAPDNNVSLSVAAVFMFLFQLIFLRIVRSKQLED